MIYYKRNEIMALLDGVVDSFTAKADKAPAEETEPLCCEARSPSTRRKSGGSPGDPGTAASADRTGETMSVLISIGAQRGRRGGVARRPAEAFARLLVVLFIVGASGAVGPHGALCRRLRAVRR